jgi:hypothetical protein
VIVHTDWLLTPERVAVHTPTATAVVADLHLGYDEARRRRGEAIPLASLDEELAPLRRVLARHEVRSVVVAGDLFEERGGAARAREFLAWFVATGVTLTAVVPGNHDRGLREEETGADGAWCMAMDAGRLVRWCVGISIRGCAGDRWMCRATWWGREPSCSRRSRPTLGAWMSCRSLAGRSIAAAPFPRMRLWTWENWCSFRNDADRANRASCPRTTFRASPTLARQQGRPFADQWDFVCFVHQQNLNMDLIAGP